MALPANLVTNHHTDKEVRLSHSEMMPFSSELLKCTVFFRLKGQVLLRIGLHVSLSSACLPAFLGAPVTAKPSCPLTHLRRKAFSDIHTPPTAHNQADKDSAGPNPTQSFHFCFPFSFLGKFCCLLKTSCVYDIFLSAVAERGSGKELRSMLRAQLKLLMPYPPWKAFICSCQAGLGPLPAPKAVFSSIACLSRGVLVSAPQISPMGSGAISW